MAQHENGPVFPGPEFLEKWDQLYIDLEEDEKMLNEKKLEESRARFWDFPDDPGGFDFNEHDDYDDLPWVCQMCGDTLRGKSDICDLCNVDEFEASKEAEADEMEHIESQLQKHKRFRS